MQKTPLTLVITLFLGVFLGIFLSRIWLRPAPPPRAAQSATHLPAPVPSLRTRFSSDTALPPSNVESYSLIEVRSAVKEIKPPISPEKKTLHGALVRRWVQLDPTEAFNYVVRMPDGELKTDGIHVMAETLAHSNPQFLTAKVSSLPNGKIRDELIRSLAARWAETEPRNALRWAQSLTNVAMRTQAIETIRLKWAQSSPQEAAREIERVAPGVLKDRLLQVVARDWAGRDR
jgi:hypothetical protein